MNVPPEEPATFSQNGVTFNVFQSVSGELNVQLVTKGADRLLIVPQSNSSVSMNSQRKLRNET